MPRWFAGLLCAVGAVVVVAAVRTHRLGRDSRSFTRTRGLVVRADVERVPRTSEDGDTQFRPVVRYAFEAFGRRYESERVSAGAAETTPSADEADARRAIERYPAGAEVDVWFDPRDPRRSVLVPGAATAQVVAAIVVGLGLVGAGLFVLAR